MEEVVDQLRAAFGAQTPAQIREANAWLESFQGRAEAWQVADQRARARERERERETPTSLPRRCARVRRIACLSPPFHSP